MTRGRLLSLAGGLIAGAVAYRSLTRADDLSGKIALITGGSRGLGLALARELGEHGCRLAIAARDERRLEAVAEELRQQGFDVTVFPCDVGDGQQAEALVGRVLERLGGLDVLINNAGTIQVGPATEMTEGDFKQALEVMFWGPLRIMYSALPHFRRQGRGRIANISSIGGKVAVPHLLPYACAKFALVALSNGLRAELAKDGVRVLTVAPGLMQTGSHWNAQFRGRRPRELGWFGLSANTPGLAMDPARAASAIVDGIRRRKGELVLSLPAKALVGLRAVAPTLTDAAFAVANRILPSAPDYRTDKRSGWQVRQESQSAVLDWVEAAGADAVRRYQ